MKINAQQLSLHFSKNIAPIYLVSGDEPLLVEETLDVIRDIAKQKGFLERIRLNSDSEWMKNFYDCTQSLSLFSEKRLIELDLTNLKLNAATSKLLQEYAAQPSETILLLIRIHKLDSKAEQSIWYKSLDKAGIVIPIWPISIDQLPNWILQRAKKLELNMAKSGAELLALLVEGNLLAASQELEKLRLLQTTDIIDSALIEDIVTDHAQFDIFSLVDSMLSGNHARCIRILKNLAAESTEPTLILWALTRELRTMIELSIQMQQGMTLATLFPKYRIWEKRQPSVRAFLQRHKLNSCETILAKAAEIDRMIKGAATGNVWNALQQLVCGINLATAKTDFA